MSEYPSSQYCYCAPAPAPCQLHPPPPPSGPAVRNTKTSVGARLMMAAPRSRPRDTLDTPLTSGDRGRR